MMPTPTVSTSSLRHELTRLVQAYERQPTPAMSIELFRVLGWNQDEYRLEPGRRNHDIQEYRLAVAGELTAYLFVAPGEPEDSAVRMAANVAYNSGIDWAAVTNFGVTKVVHARWPENPIYFSLACSQYPKRLEELELLSPHSVIDGRLTERAQSAQREREVLKPVDQRLMDRLESWRRLLLRYSEDATDQQIHELIGRLFFIRSCEDRSILEQETLLTLRSQHGSAGALGQELNLLFARLAADFDSELFLDGEGRSPVFDDWVLAEIIQDLYLPYSGLHQYRYDFSYLNVDVLGKVYERYVSTILDRMPPEEQAQLRLLETDKPEQMVEARSRRRENGIYYTPPFMVNYIVQHTVESLLKQLRSPRDLPKIADISCGSGAFLTRAAERVATWAQESDAAANFVTASHDNETPNNWRRRVISQMIGIDKDPRAVTLARVNLWILATMGEPPRPLPELSASIFAADALADPQVDVLKGTLDVVVGNPPFRSVAALDGPTREHLQRRYRSASGRFDLAYVFMERALQLLRPGGYAGFVLSNRLFTNSDARFLRELLTETATIEQVVDFGHVQAFEEGLSYTTILILRKHPPSGQNGQEGSDGERADEHHTVQVHRVQRLAEYPGLQLRRADLVGERGWQDEYSHIFAAPQPTGEGPWIWWASDLDDRIRQKLGIEAQPLHGLAISHQGVKTGDNAIFLLSRSRADPNSSHWLLRNGLDEWVELEPDLLRPCVRGKTIGRYMLGPENGQGVTEYILYPYQHGRLLYHKEMQVMYPKTYVYLQRHQDRLMQRSTVKRGGSWYGLSRARGEDWLDQPKLLTHELVRAAAFVADERGDYIPIGGSAYTPRDPSVVSLYLLLGVLNSSLMTWYLTHRAAAFRGAYRKVVSGEVMDFSFPWSRLLSARGLARRVAALAKGTTESVRAGLPTAKAEAEIDAILFDVVGLDADEQQAVRSQTVGIRAEQVPQWENSAEVQATLALAEGPLPSIERLLAQAEHTESQAVRQRLFLRARDAVLVLLQSLPAGKSPVKTTLLTFAALGIEQLSHRHPTRQQSALLREVVAASYNNAEASVEMIGDFARRLQDRDIAILPSMAGASHTLGKHLDVHDDVAQ